MAPTYPRVAAQATVVDGTGTYGRSLLFTDARVAGSTSNTGEQNVTAFNAAMALLATGGGELVFPAGIYEFVGATDVVPGGVWLRGVGHDYHTPTGGSDRPSKGAVLRATASMTRLIQLGDDPSSSASGETGCSVADLVLDGNNLAADVVKTGGRRNRIERCYVIGGTTNTVNIAGQNSYVVDSKISGEGVGNPIYIEGQNDHKIFDNEIRQSATSGAGCIRITNASKVMIRGNHLWQGANGVSAAGTLIYVEATLTNIVDGILIAGNTLEGSLSSKIYLLCSAAGGSLRNVNIVGNDFYEPAAITDNTLDIVKVDGPGPVTSINVSENTILGYDPSHRFKAIVESADSGTRSRIRVNGNVGGNVAAAWTGFTPVDGRGNVFYNGSATVQTSASGKSTQSGNGATTAFTIAHGLSTTPSTVRVTPGHSASAILFYVTADATNITVTFSSAPASASNNVVLNWAAEV